VSHSLEATEDVCLCTHLHPFIVFQGISCSGTCITALPCELNLANRVGFLTGISILSGRIDRVEVKCLSRMSLTKYFSTSSGEMMYSQSPNFLLYVHAVCQIAVDQLLSMLLFEIVSTRSRLN